MRRIQLAIALVLLCLATTASARASSMLAFSWEDELEGWQSASWTLANSTTLGVTDGSQSLLLDNLTSGFKNNLAYISFDNTSPGFAAFDLAAKSLAAGATDIRLEFDFTYDHTNHGSTAFGQLGLFVNSVGGYLEYGVSALIAGNVGSTFPSLAAAAAGDGVTFTSLGPNSIRVSMPMGDDVRLRLGVGEWYQVGFKSNGGWSGTVDWAIDNMKFTGTFVPEPSGLALSGCAFLATILMRRRDG
jgi:hypothetical protein